MRNGQGRKILKKSDLSVRERIFILCASCDGQIDKRKIYLTFFESHFRHMTPFISPYLPPPTNYLECIAIQFI